MSGPGRSGKSGGEPGGARLLELARRELLESILPALQGDARYRARLVANAMKIAARELAVEDATEAAAAAEDLRRTAMNLLGARQEDQRTDIESAAALSAALREGRLDGQRELYNLILRLSQIRRARIA